MAKRVSTWLGLALLTLSAAADGSQVPPPVEPPAVPQASPPAAAEVLQYSWRLEGFGGRLASLFVPGSGQGTLTTGPDPAGKLTTELLITSPDSANGEFWRYGAELDPAAGTALRAWSSYRFRGKSNSKEFPVATPGLVDISAAIHLLRQAPPREIQALQIWSEGHIYPVRVVPGLVERVRRAGRDVLVRRYTIEGVEEVGARFWKGRLELVLSDEQGHVPIEITVRVSLASLRLRLLEGAGVSAANAS